MNEKDKAIAQAMTSIQNRLRHVYNQGFEDGRKAERKTGKWEYGNLFRTCSVCRATTGEKDDFNDWIPDKYCPNCGARMEADK